MEDGEGRKQVRIEGEVVRRGVALADGGREGDRETERAG